MKHNWLLVSIPWIAGGNEVVPGTCRPNTTGGAGSGEPIPIGAGVGAATSGDFAAEPPKGPLNAGDGDSPCNDPCMECPKPPVVDERALVLEDLQKAQGAGGVNCGTPDDCVDKCVAESKYCSAARAVHPNKPPMIGDLFQCIDRFPPARAGGSYTCPYRYPNGDACIFSYGSRLGPLHLPAPPPICVYKSP